MIYCANPQAQYQSYKSEIDEAVSKVLNSNQFVLGEFVENFENSFSKSMSQKHAIGVANGTDALEIALRALNIKEGDEVITVSHTAVATVSAIHLTGATPVLIDIDEHTYTMDPNFLEDAITQNTKAIICVHIYGHACNIDEIMMISNKHNIPLIEDVSQAHLASFEGKTVGSFGLISCYSCYPTKNLGAIGDAGMISTNDPELAKKIRMIREYGWTERYISEIPGRNSRLDEIQAAILNIKLKYLDSDNQKRIIIANEYIKNLSDLDLDMPVVKDGCKHVFHLFVIKSKERDKLISFLNKKNIFPGIHYPFPIHVQKGYKDIIKLPKKLNITERISNLVLSLPIYPELSNENHEHICNSIREFF